MARAEAHYLILNESVGSPDCDYYDVEFWNAERRAVALERAVVAAGEARWQVDAVKSAGPIDWLSAEPELLELAELAEDDGECLVIVHG